MNTVKILHCADIHIGAADSSLGTISETRRYETLLAFEKIIDTARDNDVKLIAVAGDLFDSNRATDSFVEAVLDKIASVSDIKIVYAAGNHDPLDNTSPFVTHKRPDNLFVFGVSDECITFEDLKLHVYGKSFISPHLQGENRFSITPPDDEYTNLMVIHGDLKSDTNSDYNAITPEFVKCSGMDYIALGHVHKRTDILKLDRTWFAYCGCPEGQGFDELDDKGVYIGDIAKDLCKLEFVSIAKRKNIFEKIDIGGVSNSNDAAEKVIAFLKSKFGEVYVNNLYKIELIGEIEENVSLSVTEIESRIGALVFFVKVKDCTEVKIDLLTLATEKNLKGIFVKNMLEKINNAESDEIDTLKSALKIGLKAFNSEVKFDEA